MNLNKFFSNSKWLREQTMKIWCMYCRSKTAICAKSQKWHSNTWLAQFHWWTLYYFHHCFLDFTFESLILVILNKSVFVRYAYVLVIDYSFQSLRISFVSKSWTSYNLSFRKDCCQDRYLNARYIYCASFFRHMLTLYKNLS